ncbi:SDR family NAD(P)-dependent oxidoreductase [Streptomyces sp. NPDC054775]
MDLQLAGKVVIVTGASAGIGGATARLLTEEGAVVVGVSRRVAEDAVGKEGMSLVADLTDATAAARVVKAVFFRGAVRTHRRTGQQRRGSRPTPRLPGRR